MAELPIFYDVSSSNVQEVGYDEESMTLYVRFLPKKTGPGALYAYYGVENDIFSMIMGTDSKGRFVWQYLRDRYSYARIE